MQTLPELQDEFLRAILDRAATSIGDQVVAGGPSAAQRLAIYANTAQANYFEALRASFPAILRLVGDDYFTQCAREFRRAHPSRCGDLDAVGRAFPDYLAARHATDRFRYLGDVARLEWRYHECLTAAEHPRFDLARLAGVPAEDYDGMLLHLHPSARLFSSPYPAIAIWEANVASDAEPEVMDLDRGADRVLLIRGVDGVRFVPLASGDYAFLAALADARPLAAAITAAAEADPGFDPAAALPQFVQAGAIVDFSPGTVTPQ
jgi:hypothetical protein